MPEACRLVLPIPPSVNKSTRNLSDKEKDRMRAVGAKRIPPRVATAEMKQWRKDAGWILQTQPKSRIAGRFRIRILINQNARLDVGNVEKQTTDLLVTHRITPDDRFAQSVSAERSDEVEPGQCIVIVESA